MLHRNTRTLFGMRNCLHIEDMPFTLFSVIRTGGLRYFVPAKIQFHYSAGIFIMFPCQNALCRSGVNIIFCKFVTLQQVCVSYWYTVKVLEFFLPGNNVSVVEGAFWVIRTESQTWKSKYCRLSWQPRKWHRQFLRVPCPACSYIGSSRFSKRTLRSTHYSW